MGSPDSTDTEAMAPDIRDVSVGGTTLTITGSNFGAQPGQVELARYVAGADLEPVAAQLLSWSDTEVKLSLDSSFQGIMSVVLTNASGKHDTHLHFVSKGDAVFEQDLPSDASVGDVAVHGDRGNGLGDWEPKGPLAKMGDLFNGSSVAVLAGAGLGFLFVGRRVSRRRFS